MATETGMNKYCIRFNKSRGQEGRGSMDHVWRVFENDKEFLAKDVVIQTMSWTEQTGEDWSICCRGVMKFFPETEAIFIQSK